jgi:aspartate/tyrosine/aromatic aminotransferase
MGHFNHLETLAPDPILELMWAFKRDTRPTKIDLSVGLYYNDRLQLEILKSVHAAEEALFRLESDKAYLPIDGHPAFIQETKKLLFGETMCNKIGKSIYGAQTVGGTGALRVGGEFLANTVGSEIYVSDPTWANHLTLLPKANLTVKTYPYYHLKTHGLDFDRMIECLKGLPENTIVLLHGCCHNPTGCDPSQEQWKEISAVMLKYKLIPFFDMAYQGFGDGLEEDAYAVRLFAGQGHEMLVAFSYAKIFGLYAERVGALFIVTQNEQSAQTAGTHIRSLIRSNYSNPPKHGAMIVSYVLNHPSLKDLWKSELDQIRRRIHKMRSMLYQAMSEKRAGEDYRYIDRVKGLFCFTGLQKHQVDRLIEEYGIYMIKTGRINMTGLNEDNLSAVVEAIAKVSV